MTHKAGRSFFDSKRAWSKRKDLLLEHYLRPYLAKVGSLGRPILVVDCFAGPGRFGDGERGSPLIICDEVHARLAGKHHAPIDVCCVESDSGLHSQLVQHLQPFSFARALNQPFVSAVDEIERLARTHSVLLYVDPYAVDGLEYSALERVFRFLSEGRSVEVLLNFNAVAFTRLALASGGLPIPADDEPLDATVIESKNARLLDAVAGGPWWKELLQSGAAFPKRVDGAIEGLREKLQGTFSRVLRLDIKGDWRDAIPKYSLLFASRHPDAVILLNDAAVNSRRLWEKQTKPKEPELFEARPRELVPDPLDLDQAILDASAGWRHRRDVKIQVAEQHLGSWSESEIRGGIERLLKSGGLESETGKSRINDQVRIRRASDRPVE